MPLPIELNEDTMRDHLNSLIAKRTNYGVRDVVVLPEKYTIIGWSNGAERWFNYGSNRRPNGVYPDATVSVDANEVVVALYRDQVDKVIESLDPLPLYQNSTEARMRS